MKPFAEVAPELQPDGTLRDFYVFNFNLSLWQTFLDYIRPCLRQDSFVIDGKTAVLPQTIEEISVLRNSSSPCLSIPVGSGFLCCHFFSDTELELDFLPSDYFTEEGWGTLVDFLTEICTHLGRNGIISYENSPEWVIEIIKPK